MVVDGLIAKLVGSLGVSEAALRLILSLLFSYPLSVVHRRVFQRCSATTQHVYSVLCGLALCYFNFGSDVIHSAITVILNHLLLLFLGGSAISVPFAFLLNMTYLLASYWFSMSESYDIMWTTTQAVLTLRLIGLVSDVYDGHKAKEKITEDQKTTALKQVPSLLETLSFCYFFPGLLVGPQYSMKRYQDFVSGAFSDKSLGSQHTWVRPCIYRVLAAILYAVIHLTGSYYITESYILSPAFGDLPLISRLGILMVWVKAQTSKYLLCWLLSEGACILCGLSYNGRDENGNILWDGCANMKLLKYESATKVQDLVDSFHLTTNTWLSKYVLKRLRFLGNKGVSLFATFAFVAVWHGFHPGYYHFFLLEAFAVRFERDIEAYVSRRTKTKTFVAGKLARAVLCALQWSLYFVPSFTYANVCFVLLTSRKIHKVFGSFYYFGHIFFLSWPVINLLILKLTKSPKQARNLGEKPTKTD